MTREQLEEIKKRCIAATPGPWRVEYDSRPDIMTDVDGGGYFGEGHVATMIATVSKYGPDWHGEKWDNMDDADFIAHARTDVPALVAEIENMIGTHEAVGRLLEAVGYLYEAWWDNDSISISPQSVQQAVINILHAYGELLW